MVEGGFFPEKQILRKNTVGQGEEAGFAKPKPKKEKKNPLISPGTMVAVQMRHY